MAMQDVFEHFKTNEGKVGIVAVPEVVITSSLVNNTLEKILTKRGWHSKLCKDGNRLLDTVSRWIGKTPADKNGNKFLVFFCLFHTEDVTKKKSSHLFRTHIALFGVSHSVITGKRSNIYDHYRRLTYFISTVNYWWEVGIPMDGLDHKPQNIFCETKLRVNTRLSMCHENEYDDETCFYSSLNKMCRMVSGLDEFKPYKEYLTGRH